MSDTPEWAPAWERQRIQFVKAGILQDTSEAKAAFLTGWTAGEKYAQEAAAENLRRIINGTYR